MCQAITRFALVAGAVALFAGSAGATTGAAQAVIEQTVKDVLAVLQNGELEKAERRSRIEQIAYDRFDFRTTSRLVLARNWKKFDSSQQQEFQREFKKFLALNYGSRIERYDQEEVEITGTREEPRGDVTVKTRIVGGQYEDATVDYRLRKNKKDGGWYVIDVIVEGISLVSNYRDQFREVLSRGGPDSLLKQLREKNESGVPDPVD